MNVSHLSRISSIAALFMASRRSVASGAVVQQFLSGIAVMMGLAVTLGLCVASLLIAGLYGTYRGLVVNGLDPNIALLTVFIIMGFVVVLLLVVLRDKLRTLKEMPAAIMRAEAPITADVRQTVTSFVDGLMGRPHSPTR